MKKVAIVLSGCGVFDGSEIHETSACLVHLSQQGAEYTFFAPDIPFAAVDHSSKKPSGDTRNVLVEAARIARGKISPLKDLKATAFDAVIFPGGMGAAKNLCTFAKDGADCEVNPEVERVLKEFHGAHKPIGLCCIAPVLAGRVLKGCEVTIGNDTKTAQKIQAMGSKHVNKDVKDCHIDSSFKVVTTGAYMYGSAPLYDIFFGIGQMITNVLKLV